MKFKMTPEEEKSMREENAKLKAKNDEKPGFFSTTAGAVTVGAIGLAAGAGAGYLLFGGDKSEQPAKK